VQSCDEQTCWSGLSAAITAAPGLVVTGGLDGALEIYRTDTGGLIWSYDSLREFDAVNGVPTRGGAIDAHGPLLVGNNMVAISGYGSFGEIPGNALLVFEVPSE